MMVTFFRLELGCKKKTHKPIKRPKETQRSHLFLSDASPHSQAVERKTSVKSHEFWGLDFPHFKVVLLMATRNRKANHLLDGAKKTQRKYWDKLHIINWFAGFLVAIKVVWEPVVFTVCVCRFLAAKALTQNCWCECINPGSEFSKGALNHPKDGWFKSWKLEKIPRSTVNRWTYWKGNNHFHSACELSYKVPKKKHVEPWFSGVITVITHISRDENLHEFPWVVGVFKGTRFPVMFCSASALRNQHMGFFLVAATSCWKLNSSWILENTQPPVHLWIFSMLM